MQSWGIANARLEHDKFGRGWTSDYTSVRMIAPDTQQLGLASDGVVAGTNGPVAARS